MGLDVHLKHSKAGFQKYEADDERREAISDQAYRDNKGLSWEAIDAKVKAQLEAEGVAVATDREINSNRHPEHMFKIGYLRSSYNNGGINSVLKNLGVPDLYDIFKPPKDAYCFQPNWNQALKAVRKSIKMLRERGGLRVETVSGMFNAPTYTAREAIEVFRAEQEKHREHRGTFGNNYSSRDGLFMLDTPLKVIAAIPGQDALKRDCVHLITESKDEWYLEALEVVEENIMYVLAQPDPENWFLSWSA